MSKDKKISGCFEPFITEDESLIATFSRNSIFVYSLETKKQIQKFKSLSNISFVAISPDKNLVAVKNTSGTIALHSLETGEELLKNPMTKTEGEQFYFTKDSKNIIDIDWGGKILLFDCTDGSSKILDNTKPLIRCDGIQIDKYNKIIYRFMRKTIGYSSGIIQAYYIDEENLNPESVQFKTVNAIEENSLIGKWPICFCKNHNYYYDGENVIKTDKDFKVLSQISFNKKKGIQKLWISNNENYMFVDYGHLCDITTTPLKEIKETPNLSQLINLKSMEIVKDFDYPYISDFNMINEEKNYIISTWNGTFLGEL